jgi:hypothetical protein
MAVADKSIFWLDPVYNAPVRAGLEETVVRES